MLAPLKLHYLRWVLFDIGTDTYFMYQGIFDIDFDKYTDDAVALFTKYGVSTVFENLEGFPGDWKTNVPAFIKFVREGPNGGATQHAPKPGHGPRVPWPGNSAEDLILGEAPIFR